METHSYRMWLDDQDFSSIRVIQEIYALARERGDFHFETLEAITGHLQMTDEVLETPMVAVFSLLAWALKPETRWLQRSTLLGVTSHLRRIHAHDAIPVLVRRHQTKSLLDYQHDNDVAF